MTELSSKKCIPCSGQVPALENNEKQRLKEQIHEDWQFTQDNKRLFRQIKLKNFKQSIALANAIGDMAEQQMHHPDLGVGWGYLNIEIFTHKINDLVESDFIFAAKVDEILGQ